MNNLILDEYAAVPGEYAQPADEWTPPTSEKSLPEEARTPDEPDDTVITSDATEEPKRKSGLSQKLKTYALAAAAAVTAVTAFSSSDWNLDRAQGLLWERQLAYYAESVEELEYYAENELWYTIFGKSPDGHEAEFYGLYGYSEDGPTDEFRDALTVNPELHDNPGFGNGLPNYDYSLILAEGPNGNDIVFTWDISLLENEDQVLAAWMENGEVNQLVLEGRADGEPSDILTVLCNYDIEYDEVGDPVSRIWVYGNGTDIVGFWDFDAEKGETLVHATPEHSNDATGRGPAYLIRFSHIPAGDTDPAD